MATWLTRSSAREYRPFADADEWALASVDAADGRSAHSQALVISFALVMRDELRKCSSQMPLTSRHDPVQALLLARPHESFCVRVAVGSTRGCPDDANACHRQPLLDRSTPLRVPIADQDATVSYGARARARNLPQGLYDEGLVRMGRCAERIDTARVQYNHESGVVGHQASHRPDLGCREEVCGAQRRPVRSHERIPRHGALPTRWDAVCVEDARD